MIVMLAGPIKHWWSEYGSDAHLDYLAWRDYLDAALVEAGHLVYRPHKAFKGPWDENAQAVNEMAVRLVDVMFDLRPEGVPSAGTAMEVIHAVQFDTRVVEAPPPGDRARWPYAAGELIETTCSRTSRSRGGV